MFLLVVHLADSSLQIGWTEILVDAVRLPDIKRHPTPMCTCHLKMLLPFICSACTAQHRLWSYQCILRRSCSSTILQVIVPANWAYPSIRWLRDTPGSACIFHILELNLSQVEEQVLQSMWRCKSTEVLDCVVFDWLYTYGHVTHRCPLGRLNWTKCQVGLAQMCNSHLFHKAVRSIELSNSVILPFM